MRVIELAEGYAGPWAAALLGDLGAEVWKVEAVQRMDQTRGQVHPDRSEGSYNYPGNRIPERPWNAAMPWVRGNRNKLSVTLDLSRPEGIALFERMVGLADVVLTNMVAGVPEKMGIGYARLRELRPDLIMLMSCGFGTEGPYSHHVAMAGSMDAASGHMWLRNYAGADPSEITYSSHLDSVNATTSAYAVLTALYHRAQTGEGQFIDVSGCETFMPHLGEAILDYTLNGRIRTSIGNEHPAYAPNAVYRCAGVDDWIAISVTADAEWAGLCRVMGREDLVSDRRFATAVGRARRRSELNALIAAWTGDREHNALMRRLQEEGVPAGAVLNMKEELEDPHIRARGFLERMEGPDFGAVDISGIAWKMSATPGSVRLIPPPLAAHNDYVYREVMGLDSGEIRAMEEALLIGEVPLARLV
jgi:crotonobetainyl-CoA:carnitine CoA-transferase CaiB-like acyl-CoA transferase